MAKRIGTIRKPEAPATQAEIDRFIAVYYLRDTLSWPVAINDLLAGRERKQKPRASRISAAERRVVKAAEDWVNGLAKPGRVWSAARALVIERAKGER